MRMLTPALVGIAVKLDTNIGNAQMLVNWLFLIIVRLISSSHLQKGQRYNQNLRFKMQFLDRGNRRARSAEITACEHLEPLVEIEPARPTQVSLFIYREGKSNFSIAALGLCLLSRRFWDLTSESTTIKPNASNQPPLLLLHVDWQWCDAIRVF